MLTIPRRHRCSLSRIAHSTTALRPSSDQPAEHAEAPLSLQRGWYRDQERESRRPGRRRRYPKHDRLICCCRQRRACAFETRLVQIREQVDEPLARTMPRDLLPPSTPFRHHVSCSPFPHRTCNPLFDLHARMSSRDFTILVPTACKATARDLMLVSSALARCETRPRFCQAGCTASLKTSLGRLRDARANACCSHLQVHLHELLATANVL